MKVKKIFLTCIITLLMLTRINVSAASASLSISAGTIENGATVKASVTISAAAAWNVKITSTGNTNGCSETFADASSSGKNVNQTFSVTCKATSVGIINFTLSGDITNQDGVNTKVSGSKSVTVILPREKSSNSNLGSLSVDGYDITPNFNKDVLEYSISVPSTVEKIKINAKAADSYASVIGTGEKAVEEGINTFDITVKAEAGGQKNYKLIVNVADLSPISVTVNETNYTLIKTPKNLTKPEYFEETTVTISETTIPAFYNETLKYTLVGLKDESGNVNLFRYENDNYYPYNECKISGITFIILQSDKEIKNFLLGTTMINDIEIPAYKPVIKSDFVLLYGVNLNTEETGYYSYDTKEISLQRYDNFLVDYLSTELNDQNQYVYIFAGALGVITFFLILIIILQNKNIKKYKKIANKITDTVIEPEVIETPEIEIKEDNQPSKKIKKQKNKEKNESNE